MTEKFFKQAKHQTKSQFVYKHMSHVTKAAGIEVFYRLVKDRSRKSG